MRRQQPAELSEHPNYYTDWQVVPISNDFTRADGTLNTSSVIVHAINCLQRSPTVTVNVGGVNRTSGGHTNLGDPLDAARADARRCRDVPRFPT